MSKDPAFLFYSSDFLAGTMFFSDEQVGKYIRLLCAQHQKGKMTKKQVLSICKTYDEEIFEKFKCENDLYFNEKLDDVMDKRRLFAESRRNNGLKGGRPKASAKPSVKPSAKASANLPRNRNENENITVIEYLNKVKGASYKTTTEATRSLINARLAEGFTVDNFKTVIFKKVQEWTGGKLEKHLTPATLFCASNFEKYLNQTGNFISSAPKSGLDATAEYSLELKRRAQERENQNVNPNQIGQK